MLAAIAQRTAPDRVPAGLVFRSRDLAGCPRDWRLLRIVACRGPCASARANAAAGCPRARQPKTGAARRGAISRRRDRK